MAVNSPEAIAGRTVLRTDEVRVEGREKVSGSAAYAADAARPDMLWAAFVGSPLPHARIVSIDLTEARAMPGVHAVLSSADIGERYLGRALFDWPVLAIGVVRFIGQCVVAVAAETREIAEAAARAVIVVYDELPAIFDPEAAIAPDAVPLHDNPERYAFIPTFTGTSSTNARPVVSHPNMQGHMRETSGDVEAAFAGAHRVFEHTFATPRLFGGYIEPRATLVWIDECEMVHVTSTNKTPYALREQLSIAIGIPAESIIVETSYIGGDFGAKGFSIDEFVCYFLARATGRPVKAMRSYLEDMRSTNVRHASSISLKTGVTADGRIVGMSGRIVFNGGAYAAAKPLPTLQPGMKPIPALPYCIPNASFEMLTVYTNTVPGGHVRAPGSIQVKFAIESHLDMIARAIGEDPLSFRLRNAARAGGRDAHGHEFEDPRATEVLETLRRESDWGRPVASGKGRGVVLTMRHIGGGTTHVKAIPRPDGTIDFQSAHADQGGGALTVIQRVACEALGIPLDRVRVSRRSTAEGPFDTGAGGSKVTALVGHATLDAVGHLSAALRDAGWDGTGMISEHAVATLAQTGAEFVGTYNSRANPLHERYTYCGFVIDVSVDSATGAVTIEDVLFVGDVGTVINPLAHRGQIDGGFVFGLGTALMEELVVKEGRIQNLSLADYKLPSMSDIPPFRAVLLSDSPGSGPFGSKMVGELGTELIGPAIANAVADACGARVTSLPITAERIFELLETQRRTAIPQISRDDRTQ